MRPYNNMKIRVEEDPFVPLKDRVKIETNRRGDRYLSLKIHNISTVGYWVVISRIKGVGQVNYIQRTLPVEEV